MTSLSLHCISSRHQRESMMELEIYYPDFVIICVNCVQSARSRCGWRITLTPQTLHECIFEFSAASVLIKVVHWWWHFDEWVVYRFSYISHTIHENRIDTGCVCARVGWNNSAKEHQRKKTIPRARWWANSSNRTITSICLGYTFFLFRYTIHSRRDITKYVTYTKQAPCDTDTTLPCRVGPVLV